MEAHAEQNLFGMEVRGHARIAEGAHQDGVEFPVQHGKTIRRDGHSVGQVAFGAPVEKSHLDRNPGGGDRRHGLGDDFPSDPVAGNDGDAFFCAHGPKRYHMCAIKLRHPDSFCDFRARPAAPSTSINLRSRTAREKGRGGGQKSWFGQPSSGSAHGAALRYNQS